LIQATNALLAITVRFEKAHKVLPIFNKLIQCQAGQFDFSDIQDLRDLFAKLQSNLETSLNGLNGEEADDAAGFAVDEASLLALIEKLDKQVTASHDYAERMHGSVVQEQSISLEAQGKINRNAELLAQAHKLSDDNDSEFQQGEATRRGQLEFLSQIKSAVQALEVQFGQSLMPNIGDLVNLE
jgi:gamma-glutamyl:cysteine ligase YbdK (ATP-grasp superfamily)